MVPRRRMANRQVASERMRLLLEMADDVLSKDPQLARRYTELARKMGMRYKVRIPVEYRQRICKGCKGPLKPGVNCRVRLQQDREPHIVITCLDCGEHTRIPLRRRQR